MRNGRDRRRPQLGRGEAGTGERTDRRSTHSLVSKYLKRDGTAAGTMMGFPCLRRDGAFFASLEPTTDSLILKLPAERVVQLIESGVGRAFAPNGRRFREWITIHEPDRGNWSLLIEEAWRFASNASQT